MLLLIQPQDAAAQGLYQYNYRMQWLMLLLIQPQDAAAQGLYQYKHRMQRLRDSINTNTGCSGSGTLSIQTQDAAAQGLYQYNHRMQWCNASTGTTTGCSGFMIALDRLMFLYIYSAILRSRADSLHSQVILHECIAFYSAFFKYPPKWCTYSAGMVGTA